MLAAGLDLRTSSVTAWVADPDHPHELAGEAQRPLPSGRDGAEWEPAVWEAACRSALADAVEQAGRPPGDFLGLTVSAQRHGVVLLDSAGAPLGNGLVGRALVRLRALAEHDAERWAAASRVLSLPGWLAWRMTGLQATEASDACAAGMADVATRSWATDRLEDAGIALTRLPPVVEPGTLIGELAEGWPLPATLPVIAGCGDAQLGVMGAGGLADGVVTVVAGPDPAVHATTAAPVRDPSGRFATSTAAARDLWSLGAELAADAPAQDAVADLERVLGRSAKAVVVTGPAAASEELARRLSAARSDDVHLAPDVGVHRAACILVAKAVGAHAHVPHLPPRVRAD